MNRNSMLDPRPKPEMMRLMDGSTSHVDNISSPGESIFILDADAPTHEILEPDKVDTPLVFASPHSGRGYPSDFLESCTAPLIDLRRVEDAFVDLLVQGRRIARLAADTLQGRARLHRPESRADRT